MPNLQAEMNSLRSSTFSLMDASSALFFLYGSAGLSPVFVFENDMIIGFECFLGLAVSYVSYWILLLVRI